LGLGMLYGSIFSYGITPATDWSMFFRPQVLPMFLYIVVGGTLIPFFLFLYALRTLPPTTVSVLTCLEPFGAVVFSVLFLGMSFGWGEISGVVCVMGAVLLLTFSKEPREPTQSSD
ncbi:EamA family transporter, partial [Negativicoccus succinicivorans]